MYAAAFAACPRTAGLVNILSLPGNSKFLLGANPLSILKRRSRMISFRLSEDEYANLRSVCETAGARSVSDLARDAVHRLISKDSEIPLEDVLRALEGRVNTLDLQVQRLTVAIGEPEAESMGQSNEKM
jgi:hypothetical protein